MPRRASRLQCCAHQCSERAATFHPGRGLCAHAPRDRRSCSWPRRGRHSGCPAAATSCCARGFGPLCGLAHLASALRSCSCSAADRASGGGSGSGSAASTGHTRFKRLGLREREPETQFSQRPALAGISSAGVLCWLPRPPPQTRRPEAPPRLRTALRCLAGEGVELSSSGPRQARWHWMMLCRLLPASPLGRP